MCEADCEVWLERHGQVIGSGRATRQISRRLRRALEHRDRCCVVPGCGATRGLHAHHIRHWEDGGATELDNLVLLCPYHHRLHHSGGITITGPAQNLVVTDADGKTLNPGSLARPPTQPRPSVKPCRGPLGERAEWWWYTPFEPHHHRRPTRRALPSLTHGRRYGGSVGDPRGDRRRRDRARPACPDTAGACPDHRRRPVTPRVVCRPSSRSGRRSRPGTEPPSDPPNWRRRRPRAARSRNSTRPGSAPPTIVSNRSGRRCGTSRIGPDAVRSFTVEERRSRLARRHFLAEPTDRSVADVANSFVGLHATDPATPYLSLWARLPGLPRRRPRRRAVRRPHGGQAPRDAANAVGVRRRRPAGRAVRGQRPRRGERAQEAGRRRGQGRHRRRRRRVAGRTRRRRCCATWPSTVTPAPRSCAPRCPNWRATTTPRPERRWGGRRPIWRHGF